MKKLLTVHDSNKFPFLQMPQVFYEASKYESMRLESKVAYTLMANLLSLSIKNNWTNKKGEVYVKFSRKTLMKKLQFKGTQKAAAIMKELVDYGLIFIKRIGLNRCNEIYLYSPDCKPRKAGVKAKTAETQENIHVQEQAKEQKQASLPPAEFSTQKEPQKPESKETLTFEAPKVITQIAPMPPTPQMPRPEIHVPNPISTVQPASEARAPLGANMTNLTREVEDLLENKVHLAHLRQAHDPNLVDEIGRNIAEMFCNTSTRIGQQDKPMSIMHGTLRKLEMYHIEHVIARFREVTATTEIRNTKKYLQTMIYNSVYEANARMIGHIRYNFGYC